ncbi:MAG: hypothetical protein R3301_15600, partial [Saprospiraceae bacterium]|nr:hypothetical protein [Saprospiraceae bacterium]
MVQHIILSIGLLCLGRADATAQKIFGIAGDVFGSYDLETLERDTMFYLVDRVTLNAGFNSTIDRFNGRYFFGGNLPGYEGNFHVIDLNENTVSSHHVTPTPTHIEYDFVRNRLVFESDGGIYSMDLQSLVPRKLSQVENSHSTIWGQKRT